MKIKCPSCTTAGRVPDGKIPSGGANIRCPSCTFVFFVGGPDGINVLPEDAPSTGSTGAIDVAAVARVRAAAAEAVAAAQGPGEDASATEEDAPAPTAGRAAAPSGAQLAAASSGFAGYGGAAGFAGYGATAAGRASQSTPAVPSAPPVHEAPSASAAEDAAASSSGLGARGARAYHGSGAVAAVPSSSPAEAPRHEHSALNRLPAAPLSAEPTPAVDPAAQSVLPGTEGAPQRRRGAAWKVRNALGITYDFPDTPNLRRWLESRPSLDELSASNDGGTSWRPPAEFAELSDVRASGIRTSASTDSVRMARSTASVRTVAADPDAASPPGARGPSGSVAIPGPTTMPPATKGIAHAQEGSAADAANAMTDRMAAAARGANTAGSVRRDSSHGHGTGAQDEAAPSRKRLVVLSVIAVVVAIGAGALRYVTERSGNEVTIPNTPAGQQLRWVLTTIQGGADVLSNANIEARFAPAVLERVSASTLREQLEYYDSWRDEYRPLRFARSPTSTLIELVVVTNGGDTGVIRVETEPEEPYRLVGLNFRGAD